MGERASEGFHFHFHFHFHFPLFLLFHLFSYHFILVSIVSFPPPLPLAPVMDVFMFLLSEQFLQNPKKKNRSGDRKTEEKEKLIHLNISIVSSAPSGNALVSENV
jgi:hypothetical protein